MKIKKAKIKKANLYLSLNQYLEMLSRGNIIILDYYFKICIDEIWWVIKESKNDTRNTK